MSTLLYSRYLGTEAYRRSPKTYPVGVPGCHCVSPVHLPMSSSQRTLSVYEIRLTVFQQAYWQAEQRGSLYDFITLATLSRHCFNMAVDLLWQELPSIAPLLHVLPDDVIKKQLINEEWIYVCPLVRLQHAQHSRAFRHPFASPRHQNYPVSIYMPRTFGQFALSRLPSTMPLSVLLTTPLKPTAERPETPSFPA